MDDQEQAQAQVVENETPGASQSPARGANEDQQAEKSRGITTEMDSTKPKKDLKKKPKKKSRTKSSRAGLQFPVGRTLTNLRRARIAKRTGSGAAVYLTAVMEYLTAELLELAGNSARDRKRKRIDPRDITMAVRNDEEMNKMLSKTTIAHGGVLPNIHSVLLPKKKNPSS